MDADGDYSKGVLLLILLLVIRIRVKKCYFMALTRLLRCLGHTNNNTMVIKQWMDSAFEGNILPRIPFWQ